MTDPAYPASPTPATTTRARMLDVALDLFHAKGIHATSVEEILQASGTGKSQLYHYFGSKDGLVHDVVLEFERRLLSGEIAIVDRLETVDDLARWLGFFVEHQVATDAARHCPMATIAAGLGPGHEETRRAVDRIFKRARRRLRSLFQELARTGRLSPDASPTALADLCYAVMQGGLIVSRVERDVQPFRNAVDEALRHVRSRVRE